MELYDWSRPPALRLQNFLCRLLTRPDLAKRVKRYRGSGQSHILYENDREEDEPYGLDMSAVTEEDWTRIRAAIRVLEPEGERTSLWNIENGSWEAMTTLVLSLLPNLEELEFSDWPPYGDELPSLTAFLKRSADSQRGDKEELIHTSHSALACLKNTSLIWRDDKNGMSLEALFPFMKLSSLQSISGRRVLSYSWGRNDIWESESERPDFAKGLDFGHITNISLHWSAITDGRLAFLLRHCPNLRRLLYEHSGEVGPADFEAPKILLALLPVRSSLQEIAIYGHSFGK